MLNFRFEIYMMFEEIHKRFAKLEGSPIERRLFKPADITNRFIKERLKVGPRANGKPRKRPEYEKKTVNGITEYSDSFILRNTCEEFILEMKREKILKDYQSNMETLNSYLMGHLKTYPLGIQTPTEFRLVYKYTRNFLERFENMTSIVSDVNDKQFFAEATAALRVTGIHVIEISNIISANPGRESPYYIELKLSDYLSKLSENDFRVFVSLIVSKIMDYFYDFKTGIFVKDNKALVYIYGIRILIPKEMKLVINDRIQLSDGKSMMRMKNSPKLLLTTIKRKLIWCDLSFSVLLECVKSYIYCKVATELLEGGKPLISNSGIAEMR